MRTPVLVAAFFVLSLVAFGAALSFRSADLQRLARQREENCLAIEVLKAQLRPEPFDLSNTQRILTDLRIDPASETGKRLISTSRANNTRERKQLAPREC